MSELPDGADHGPLPRRHRLDPSGRVSYDPGAAEGLRTMQIVQGSEHAQVGRRRPVVAVGNFDGVHLGHQTLLRRARALAVERRAPTVVLTFRPHPARLLPPEAAPC